MRSACAAARSSPRIHSEALRRSSSAGRRRSAGPREHRADPRLAEGAQEVADERVVVDPGVRAVLVLDRERHDREVVFLGDPEQARVEGEDPGPAAGGPFREGREGQPALQDRERALARALAAVAVLAVHEHRGMQPRGGAEQRPAADLRLRQEGTGRSGEHGEDVDVGAVVAEQEMRPGQRRAAYLDLDSERADQSPRPGVAVA